MAATKSRLTVRNKSRIPDEVVERVLQVVRPPRVRRLVVEIRSSRSSHARGRASVLKAFPYVVVWVGDREFFPVTDTGGTSPESVPWGRLRTQTEALVAVLAHEFHHIRQARSRRRPRTIAGWEKPADRAAVQYLKRWRNTRRRKNRTNGTRRLGA